MGEGESQEAAANKYTFGDNLRASARLRRLAGIYEPESRELLRRSGINATAGCGSRLRPRLGHPPASRCAETKPNSWAGCLLSIRREARTRHCADLEFKVHDIVSIPFPIDTPDVMFCRFLLTHLRSLKEVLAAWAEREDERRGAPANEDCPKSIITLFLVRAKDGRPDYSWPEDARA